MAEVRYNVAKVGDIANGEMREVTAGDTTLLLANVDGHYHALNPLCTHYGAPLVDGSLSQGRIICPWHHTCFDATSGKMIDPPALDDLCHANASVEDDVVYVTLPDDWSDRRVPAMVKRNSSNAECFIVVGGGAAGYMAAQTLREEGFTGRLLLVSDDTHLAYDRPNLSKNYLAGTADPEWMPLRPEAFYDEHDIEILTKRVTSIKGNAKTIAFDDGTNRPYDAALIATGGVPRALDVPGADLENVFLLRRYDDADAILDAVPGASKAVVIGASFIGMEVAASLRQHELAVTVVAPDGVPFERTLGEEIGLMLQGAAEEKGVAFRLGRSVASIEGDKRVQRVVLDDGTTVSADIVIVGVGVRPATAFIKGVRIEKDGGISVDNFLSAADALYAAGDVAGLADPATGARVRIEHWRTAQQEGRLAARNMLGAAQEYRIIPFFWTEQFGLSLRYLGRTSGKAKLIVHGNIDAHDFIAFFVEDERVTAVASMERDTQMAAIEALMMQDRLPGVEELRSRRDIDFADLARR